MQENFDVGQYLLSHHIRPSYQRVRIYQYLIRYRSHPGTDEIYNALHPEIPTLSRTTVYNTLDLFARRRIVRLLPIDDTQMRYDADMSPHGHFLCLKCHRVYDFSIDSLLVSGLNRFDVMSKDVFYRGICPSCRQNGGPDCP